jgi:hypothetical protein
VIIIPTEKEQLFIDAYIEAIYFTETGDIEQPATTTELDSDFLRSSYLDCMVFYAFTACYLPDSEGSIEQAGHDFWLSRNGHGTGFFDRDYPEAELLQKLAEDCKGADALFEGEFLS